MEFPIEEPSEPRIVYEDDWIVAVLKPARMHSAPGLGSGDLCAWTFERYPEAKELRRGAAGLGDGSGPEPRGEGGLLHRLDYETSGLILFARKPAAFASLLEQQARGAFRKEYLALSSPSREPRPSGSDPIMGLPEGLDPGDWSEARGTLDARRLSELLGGAVSRGSCGIASAFKSFGPKGGRVACLGPREAGGSSLYRSEVLGCSLAAHRGGDSEPLELRLSLSRGFRHQIRAQLAWIGLPILGDPLYGGRTDERLRLYAVCLRFAHPESGQAMSLDSEET
jgi:23S rRNA-/tRNA-specific pseudouridylate synthase